MVALVRVIRAIRGHSVPSSFVIFCARFRECAEIQRSLTQRRKAAKESTGLLFPLRLCVTPIAGLSVPSPSLEWHSDKLCNTPSKRDGWRPLEKDGDDREEERRMARMNTDGALPSAHHPRPSVPSVVNALFYPRSGAFRRGLECR